MKRFSGALLMLVVCNLAPPAHAEAPAIGLIELADQLTDALPGYVNREYARTRTPGHLVLTGEARIRQAAGLAFTIDILTLERFFERGQLIPVLIERQVVVAPSAGTWYLSTVRSVFRTIPEAMDSRLGPYLTDYPKAKYDPPTIAGLPPYTALDSAFSKAVAIWLRDVQLAKDDSQPLKDREASH